MKHQTTVRIEEDILKNLKIYADKDNRSVGYLINYILRKYFNDLQIKK